MFGGAFMCIWCMYAHICLVFHIILGDNPKPQFVLFMVFMKSGAFHMKSDAFHEKHIKSNQKHLKSEKHMKSTPESEKHLKGEKHMKST